MRQLFQSSDKKSEKILTGNFTGKINSLTSFPFIKYSGEERPSIYILTQERLQLFLQRNERNIDILIVDEAYKFGDNTRGILLQHVVEKTIFKNPAAKVIYISPMVRNPEVFIKDESEGYSKKFEDVTVNQNLIWATQKRGAKWTLELYHDSRKTLIRSNRKYSLDE